MDVTRLWNQLVQFETLRGLSSRLSQKARRGDESVRDKAVVTPHRTLYPPRGRGSAGERLAGCRTRRGHVEHESLGHATASTEGLDSKRFSKCSRYRWLGPLIASCVSAE